MTIWRMWGLCVQLVVMPRTVWLQHMVEGQNVPFLIRVSGRRVPAALTCGGLIHSRRTSDWPQMVRLS